MSDNTTTTANTPRPDLDPRLDPRLREWLAPLVAAKSGMAKDAKSAGKKPRSLEQRRKAYREQAPFLYEHVMKPAMGEPSMFGLRRYTVQLTLKGEAVCSDLVLPIPLSVRIKTFGSSN
jgi:hypothetical protein